MCSEKFSKIEQVLMISEISYSLLFVDYMFQQVFFFQIVPNKQLQFPFNSFDIFKMAYSDP